MWMWILVWGWVWLCKRIRILEFMRWCYLCTIFSLRGSARLLVFGMLVLMVGRMVKILLVKVGLMIMMLVLLLLMMMMMAMRRIMIMMVAAMVFVTVLMGPMVMMSLIVSWLLILLRVALLMMMRIGLMIQNRAWIRGWESGSATPLIIVGCCGVRDFCLVSWMSFRHRFSNT
eukprot:TRINITY_DN18116_c0_g1::TRINITY_DN18116_c0_g1_i1::g.24025::m.24025 TRINITY_DN18116_c0_g1::TRINITY_DN18116_c0_g1_i1::g.24025  ORF type:complete len:173 (+),score=-25.31,DUF3273/PF11677.3/0.018 TRINITY_DN18116_c0_g1_i1:102-620(+)